MRLVSRVLCYHQAIDPTTCPINCIAGNKHRQLARQVGGVVMFNLFGLMAPIDVSAVTLVAGMEITFGSLNFIAGLDERLHVSNLEATRIGRIVSDPTDHRSGSESDPLRVRLGVTLPRYTFQFRNSADTFLLMLQQLIGTQPEYETDSGRSLSREDDDIPPADDEFRAV